MRVLTLNPFPLSFSAVSGVLAAGLVPDGAVLCLGDCFATTRGERGEGIGDSVGEPITVFDDDTRASVAAVPVVFAVTVAAVVFAGGIWGDVHVSTVCILLWPRLNFFSLGGVLDVVEDSLGVEGEAATGADGVAVILLSPTAGDFIAGLFFGKSFELDAAFLRFLREESMRKYVAAASL
jgi:hypothetical protein